MAHNRNASFEDRFDGIYPFLSTLDLYCIISTFFKKSTGVADRFKIINLLGHKWQIAHEKRMFRCPSDGFAVVNQLIHGDRQCVLQA
jgi:hypothetical protein